MVSLDPQQLFPFPLDPFQLEAIAALQQNRSVVVCAPTGSGKTLVGEYAIYRALALGRRVFYTTPLKALSNQKFRDFGEQFGPEQVGLLTGDISINRDAPVVVMTTEIFRNMLYGTAIGEVGTSLEGVQAVVLDECHYMNDQQRGTVWEESIIYCPGSIQLVALSATIANSDQLTAWMNAVHGPTDLVYSDHRSVPLEFSFVNTKGMFPLLEERDGQWVCNPRLKPKRPLKSLGKNAPRPIPPDLNSVILKLQQRQMLPAIYFIFSRRGCDLAVTQLQGLNLVEDPQEQQLLKAQIDQFCRTNPEAIRQDQVGALYRGIAAHHAGLLPIWKVLVESLFQQGLVKVVFATETLAAGINMPARTTVISSLSKRTDNGHRLLTASEFMQMSGRAGRRGKDTLGYVVTLQSPFEGAPEAARLATVGADPLVSQFTPSYGMVLNLLQRHSLQEAQELVNRSFGQFLLSQQELPQQAALAAVKAELAEIEAQLATVTPEALQRYEKWLGQLREEKRVAQYLEQCAQEDPSAAAELHAQEQRIHALRQQLSSSPVHIHYPKLREWQEKRRRLERKMRQLIHELETPVSQSRWQQFLALADVLQEFGCLTLDYQILEPGETAAAIRGDNELWLALVLRSGEVDQLDPQCLAGVLGALVNESPRSDTRIRCRPSEQTEEALVGLRSLRRQLFRSQRHHEVFMVPVWLEVCYAGLVEQWALGMEWEDLERSTTLDAGDLVRIIRRTVDVLSQIPHVPHVPAALKQTARQAQQLMDRFPIAEEIVTPTPKALV